jgi:hypothetical protein
LPARGALVALAVAIGAAGCGGPKREATVLIDAVRRFHEADNPGKPAAADVIAKVPCKDSEVCAAKAACVAACGAWGEALRKMAETQVGLDEIKSGKLSASDPAAKLLPAKLAEAQAKLTQGKDTMAACDEAVFQLKTEHGI